MAVLATAAVVAVRVGGAIIYVVTAALGVPDVHVSAQLPLGLEDVGPTTPGLVASSQLGGPGRFPVAINYPSGWQFALWLFAQLPSLAVYQAFFLMLRRWVRSARANGPFTHGGTVTLRLIGLLLITATPVAAALEALARGLLTATVTTRHAFVFSWDFPGYAVVGGMGLVAVAEILHRGTTLREDVEATI
jgi:hypothetical protein